MAPGDAAGETVTLQGLFALVVDDDPAVATSLGDVLRGQGCAVIQLGDGGAALDCALHETPDIVLADLLMPGLPGVRLTRRLREDPVLRDVPVVLLSWKDDWLAAAKQAAEGPTGYLTKGSDAEAVLSRVRGVLERRTDLELRLRTDGEVSGSLEDVTAHRLLRMASSLRPDARLTVRDSAQLCEVQLRDGVPLSATCVSAPGTLVRGTDALVELLRIRVGRFSLATERGPVETHLRGSLAAQLESHVARLRAAGDATPLPQVHTEPMFFRPAPRRLDHTAPLSPPSWQPNAPPSRDPRPLPAAGSDAPRPALKTWMMAAAVVAVGAAGIALGALLRVLQNV